MATIFDNLFWLHYEGEGEGGEGEGGEGEGGGDSGNQTPPGKKPPAGRFLTQEQIDEIVTKRTAKARRQQQQTLEQLEQMQQSLQLTDEQRETMEAELESFRRKVMSQEEIAKREKQRADKEYKDALERSKKEAEFWKGQHNNLKVGYEIKTAASEFGVLPQQMPFLEAFFKQSTKVVEQRSEDGSVANSVMVQFTDQGADGKPLPVELTVQEAVKRMKEMPESYGHLFQASSGGGVGGHSGTPQGGKKGFRTGMSMEEYLKLRRENPEALNL